jgi:demethylmenaquinone methyltransferase / 2-methoxy-6-polyprenyl-1,4-benzoquinol methylase
MSERIHNIFTNIAGHYDVMNHLFSLGVDLTWRRRASELAIEGRKRIRVLDLATGTADIAIEISKLAAKEGKSVSVVASDFNRNMLKFGREKVERSGLKNIKVEFGDAMSIKYPKGSFDVVTTAFSLRNFDDIGRFADEAKRVLKPGGTVIALDMGRPKNSFWLAFSKVYFVVMRAVGTLIDKESYDWLTYSVMRFDRDRAAGIIGKRFKEVEIVRLKSDIAFIIVGRK